YHVIAIRLHVVEGHVAVTLVAPEVAPGVAEDEITAAREGFRFLVAHEHDRVTVEDVASGRSDHHVHALYDVRLEGIGPEESGRYGYALPDIVTGIVDLGLCRAFCIVPILDEIDLKTLPFLGSNLIGFRHLVI